MEATGWGNRSGEFPPTCWEGDEVHTLCYSSIIPGKPELTNFDSRAELIRRWVWAGPVISTRTLDPDILENAAFPWTAVPAKHGRRSMEAEGTTTQPSHLSPAGTPTIPCSSNPTMPMDVAAILKMTSQAIEDINVLQSKRKDLRF
ncbi:hypothetical protein Bbelb_233640 [Branchiostoma belcheri]|nr:hypothetical protein Bbelb_233640 [Branchiostoma belcheri]